MIEVSYVHIINSKHLNNGLQTEVSLRVMSRLNMMLDNELIETPLILSLSLDAPSQQYFNALRERHFPPERNYLEAHLTLFHHLPGAEIQSIREYLLSLSQKAEKLALSVKQVKMIGRGVAFPLENEVLQQLHAQMAKRWKEWLTPQDRQKLWPHITVQNKVEAKSAKKLHQELSEDFQPFVAYGTGFSLWAYRNGPWQWLQNFPFEQN